MKKALTTLAFAALLLAGAGLAGCASSRPGTDAAKKCADCGCPDCKTAGSICWKCKDTMKKKCAECGCPDCKAMGDACGKCCEKMGM